MARRFTNGSMRFSADEVALIADALDTLESLKVTPITSDLAAFEKLRREIIHAVLRVEARREA